MIRLETPCGWTISPCGVSSFFWRYLLVKTMTFDPESIPQQSNNHLHSIDSGHGESFVGLLPFHVGYGILEMYSYPQWKNNVCVYLQMHIPYCFQRGGGCGCPNLGSCTGPEADAAGPGGDGAARTTMGHRRRRREAWGRPRVPMKILSYKGEHAGEKPHKQDLNCNLITDVFFAKSLK